MVSFPVREKNYDRSKDQVSIWQQFVNAADLQKHWADNQVSITITFRKDESAEIRYCLEAFEDRLKSVSLLPLSDHGYTQAPYEEITKERYDSMVSKLKDLEIKLASHEADDKFCDGEACLI